jgi:hypothetical protein
MATQTLMVDQRELLQKAERFIPGGCLGMIVLPADLRMVMVRGQGSKVYVAIASPRPLFFRPWTPGGLG